MIFALLDYLQYRSNRGPYSPARIAREGGILAVPGPAARFANHDCNWLFYYHAKGAWRSWLVNYLTSSIWSHTGVFTENGCVCDATTSGVVEHPFSDYLDGRSYYALVRVAVPLSEAMKQRTLGFLRNSVGAGYNWAGVWRLFFATVIGRHMNFRWKFAADILVFLLFWLPLAFLWQPIIFLIGATAAIYVLCLGLTTPARRRMAVRTGIVSPG